MPPSQESSLISRLVTHPGSLSVWALNYCLPSGRAPEPSRSRCPRIPSSVKARPLSSWLRNICSDQYSSWFSYPLTEYPTHLPGECYGSTLLLIPLLGSVPISKKNQNWILVHVESKLNNSRGWWLARCLWVPCDCVFTWNNIFQTGGVEYIHLSSYSTEWALFMKEQRWSFPLTAQKCQQLNCAEEAVLNSYFTFGFWWKKWLSPLSPPALPDEVTRRFDLKGTSNFITAATAFHSKLSLWSKNNNKKLVHHFQVWLIQVQF